MALRFACNQVGRASSGYSYNTLDTIASRGLNSFRFIRYNYSMNSPSYSHHVVIVGAGFGGLRVARALRKAKVQITLIDRHNYHLFQPLLYQVATAGLSPTEIAHPVRAILRRQRNFNFRLDEVIGIDFANKTLQMGSGQLSYDALILAIGGRTNFFGLQSVAQNAFGLKELEEAVAIRNQVLTQFEMAVHEPDPEVRRARLTFAVVGGGPTGVESAGALSELIRLVLIKDYPSLNIKDVRILLLEATDKLLANLPEDLREAAAATLWRKYIEVRFGASVIDFDGKRITLKSGEVIPSHTLIWAAGVQAEKLADTLGLPQKRQGRIAVLPTLQTGQYPEVFVIGDAAYLEDNNGQPLPMVAPVAMQQAKVAAANVVALLQKQSLVQFVYKDPGSLATIGRNAAVAQFGRFKFRGWLAWCMWLVVHIIQLIGFRNRLLVLINWAWDYFFYDRAVRLIIADSSCRQGDEA